MNGKIGEIQREREREKSQGEEKKIVGRERERNKRWHGGKRGGETGHGDKGKIERTREV